MQAMELAGCGSPFLRSLLSPEDQQDTANGYALLLRILLYADDLTVLARHPQDIGEWATAKGLEFSAKSFYTPLCSNLATLEVIENLRLQHLTLKIKFEVFTCLGVPINPYEERVSPMVVRPVAKGPLGHQLHLLLQQHFIRGRHRTVLATLWRKAVWSAVLPQQLYPTTRPSTSPSARPPATSSNSRPNTPMPY